MPSMMKYSPDQETAIMKELWSDPVRDDPEAFVMVVFPWKVKGTPLALFDGPRTWQRDVLRLIRDKIRENKAKGRGEWDTMNDAYEMMKSAVSSGRGIGKSALVSWLTLWMLSTRIGSSVIISANSEAQLRSVTWGELSKWVAMSLNSHWWEFSATKIVPQGWLVEMVERDMKKGTRYWSAEGKLWSEENPDSYAGAHNMDGMMVIFDEASGISDGIWSVAGGYFTEPVIDRYWMAFSNPRRNSGYFYECFNSKQEFWDTRTIDSRTVEGTDKGVYDQIIKEYGEESRQAKIEVYGEFPGISDDTIIPAFLVEGAMNRDIMVNESEPEIWGLDVARFGDDRSVLVKRRGKVMDMPPIVWKNKDLMQLSGLVKMEYDICAKKPQEILVDSIGLGSGVVDRLRELNLPVRGINVSESPAIKGTYLNLRAELWFKAKAWFESRQVKIPKEDRGRAGDSLFADLTQVKYDTPGSQGKIQVESKRDMKKRLGRSSDISDAFVLTFASDSVTAMFGGGPASNWNKALKRGIRGII